MTINEITASEFAEHFTPSHIYNGIPFTKLNATKVDSINYLSIGDNKMRFGIILGKHDNKLCSPFSAPFGGFTIRGVQSIRLMDEAVNLLKDYAKDKGLGLRIALQPIVYDETQLSKLISAFLRAGYKHTVDLNYYFSLHKFDNYTKNIERSARKNLSHAMQEDFTFEKLDSHKFSDVARAYEVIRRNREEHDYPLRMSVEQVWQTVTEVVKADFFVLSHEGNDIAAAQVFHVAEGIAQVIYWGDIRKYSNLRPMNYLTYEIFRHYRKAGLKILDIGPSTENGEPNYGLCEFKENIGCDVTLKYWFTI